MVNTNKSTILRINIFIFSFSSLTKLKLLDLSKNLFSCGLPDVFGDLISLEKLYLTGDGDTKLTCLPAR